MGDQPTVSLDIKIPISWKSDEFIHDDVIIKTQDKNNNYKLLSIVAVNTKEGYDSVFLVANLIVKENKEDEEKLKLFNDKVEELLKKLIIILGYGKKR